MSRTELIAELVEILKDWVSENGSDPTVARLRHDVELDLRLPSRNAQMDQLFGCEVIIVDGGPKVSFE